MKSVKIKDSNILKKEKKFNVRTAKKSPTAPSGFCRFLHKESISKTMKGQHTAQVISLRLSKIHKEFTKKREG